MAFTAASRAVLFPLKQLCRVYAGLSVAGANKLSLVSSHRNHPRNHHWTYACEFRFRRGDVGLMACAALDRLRSAIWPGGGITYLDTGGRPPWRTRLDAF